MKSRGRRRLSPQAQSLPEELLEQIIERVTCLKSLGRWTSVCKSWYAFITSTRFVKFHLSLIQQPTYVDDKYLLCELDEFVEAKSPLYDNPLCPLYDETIEAFENHPYFVRHRDDDCNGDELILEAPYFAIHTDTEALHEYIGLYFPLNLLQLDSCNGLICYNTSDDPCTLYLWNPVIRKLKQLPTPPPNLSNDDQHSVFKLWFDSNTNDHNILRITYTTRSCSVEVYSLSTNSWKIITDDAPVTTSFLNKNRLAYVNRTFYWPALRDGNWMLISLQVDNWMFSERFTSWTASRLYFTPSKDNVSLVILGNGDKDDGLDDIFALWGSYFHSLNKFNTMDTRDAHKFNTMDTRDAHWIDGRFQPLGIRNNGDLLLQNIDELNVISYCVETKQYKDFLPATSRRLMRTIPFVRTLALLNDADSYSTQ